MTLTVAQLFNDAAKKLRAEFEYIRSTNPHPGEKGAEAENVVRDFLNHHLPQRFRATSGIIIDKANSLSPQTDVIIYDALTSPVYRYSEEMLMLPSPAPDGSQYSLDKLSVAAEVTRNSIAGVTPVGADHSGRI